jgi:hypothetical protein
MKRTFPMEMTSQGLQPLIQLRDRFSVISSTKSTRISSQIKKSGDDVPDVSRVSNRKQRSSLKQADTPIAIITVRRRSRPKKLSFDANVKLIFVEPISALTNHPEKVWYQQKELQKIETKIGKILKKVEGDSSSAVTVTAGHAISSGGEEKASPDLRGLERKIPNQQRVIRAHQTGCWESVFQEQSRQRTQGIVDEQALSEVARRSSSHSGRMARLQAQQDAKDVKSYLRKGERYYCRILNCEIFYQGK